MRRVSRCVLPLSVVIMGLAPGCSGAPAPGGSPPPCTVGADQTCNDDPTISSLWGRCTEQGLCECKEGCAKPEHWALSTGAVATTGIMRKGATA